MGMKRYMTARVAGKTMSPSRANWVPYKYISAGTASMVMPDTLLFKRTSR